MTRVILLFTFYLFVTSPILGQAISKPEIIKFKIKTIKTIDEDGKVEKIEYFDENGNVIKKGSFSEDNKIQIEEEYLYDTDAKIVEERKYDFQGKIHSTTKHFYNRSNKLIKSQMEQFDKIEATWIYEYDENGNMIIETQTSESSGNSITKFKYDLANNLIQENKSNGKIDEGEVIKYKYNREKQLIEKKNHVNYFNTTIKQTYIYSEKGKVAEVLEKSSNGVSSKSTYQYNENDLLVSQVWKSSLGKESHKTNYEFGFE
ncbi:MAG: hypothetical protein ACRCVT_13605 [Leadbetterella sp.]